MLACYYTLKPSQFTVRAWVYCSACMNGFTIVHMSGHNSLLTSVPQLIPWAQTRPEPQRPPARPQGHPRQGKTSGLAVCLRSGNDHACRWFCLTLFTQIVRQEEGHNTSHTQTTTSQCTPHLLARNRRPSFGHIQLWQEHFCSDERAELGR